MCQELNFIFHTKMFLFDTLFFICGKHQHLTICHASVLKRERERERERDGSSSSNLFDKSTCRLKKDNSIFYMLFSETALFHARFFFEPGNRNLFVSNQRGMKKAGNGRNCPLMSAVEFVQSGETLKNSCPRNGNLMYRTSLGARLRVDGNQISQ